MVSFLWVFILDGHGTPQQCSRIDAAHRPFFAKGEVFSHCDVSGNCCTYTQGALLAALFLMGTFIHYFLHSALARHWKYKYTNTFKRVCHFRLIVYFQCKWSTSVSSTTYLKISRLHNKDNCWWLLDPTLSGSFYHKIEEKVCSVCQS